MAEWALGSGTSMEGDSFSFLNQDLVVCVLGDGLNLCGRGNRKGLSRVKPVGPDGHVHDQTLSSFTVMDFVHRGFIFLHRF